MKGLLKICLVVLIAMAVVFSVTACGNNDTVVYEITVDRQQVSADTGLISVYVYALDGSKVAAVDLTGNKAEFALKADSYVATLVGLDETVSFSSVLLTKDSRKATITLSNSVYDDFAEVYNFAFTVIMLSGDKKLDELNVTVCDALMCRDVEFGSGNVADVSLVGGSCTVDVYDANMEKLFYDTFELDLNMRFYVINL